MNNLKFRRNYKYILILISFIILAFVFSNTRIISYNFGKYSTELEVAQINIENTIDIFNDEIIHDIEIGLTDQEYINLILYYKENSEKEYIQTDVTIDGQEIKDVGVKLKGNQIIVGTLDTINTDEIDFGFFLKFDKYIEGQAYLGYSEISIISGDISELTGEYIAGKVFDNYGIESAQSSFGKLIVGETVSGTYLIKETINDDFLEYHYEDENGLLYKAENSISFSYLGEDPTHYTDLFTQKSLLYNYDLNKLIEVLNFVSTSSESDFVDKFTNYINIENYTKFLAINSIIYAENDKFDLLNSYYIYFDLSTETIKFIPWDSQYLTDLEFSSAYEILEKVFSKQEIANLTKRDIRGILDNFSETDSKKLKEKYTNDLENNFTSEEGFSELYITVKKSIEDDLDDSQYIENLQIKINTLLGN